MSKHNTQLLSLGRILNRSVLSIALASLCALGASSSLANDQTDALLQQAKAFEASADYQNAFNSYRQYLLQPAPKSAARRHARLKLPVLQEAVKYGVSPELSEYLVAMDLRAAGKVNAADAKLQAIIETYPGGPLSDDAWYLRAYIALMDHYEYQRATDMLQTLRSHHPESRYIDTALFAEAIAQEQLGNGDAAIAKMTELRDRHTGVSLGGMNWAKDEYLSRLWFERSSNRIKYLEKRADIATKLVSMTPYGIDGYQWQAQLIVANKDFTLLLNESDALNYVSDTGVVSASDFDVNAYSGVVMGEHDSWARVTIDGQSIRGMISTYNEQVELVPMNSGGTLSDFHTLLLGDENGNVSDETDQINFAPQSKDRTNNYLRSIRGVSDIQLTPGEVSHVAVLGVVIDSKYNSYHNGRGVQEAMSILNTTDGIFREQLGIALKINPPIVISADNDPMNLGSVTMETMMRNFKDYRVSSNLLGSDIGLATLFSGNKNSDSALGLAWIGSACRTDGYDVSVVTPYKMPSLLSTHEIGHTMGAPHDSDTACSSQNRHMMWPFLSSNSGRTFSSCSIESIAQTMASNNCHLDAMDLELNLDDINDSGMQLSVTNLDTQRATPDATVKVSGPAIGSATLPSQCSSTGDNNVQCYVGTLTPLDSITLEFSFAQPLASTDKIVSNVIGNGFMDVVTHNNNITTDVEGNITTVASAINNDPISNWGASSGSSDSNSGDVQAKSSGGGGLFHPVGLIALTGLYGLRRRTRSR